MFPALLLSATLIAAAEPAAAQSDCTVAQAMKGKMLPTTSTDPRSNVAHGALLYYGDAFAGVIYGTASGAVWYQSAGKFSGTVSSAARERAMTMLSINSAPSGDSPVMAPNPSFAAILAPDVRLMGCF